MEISIDPNLHNLDLLSSFSRSNIVGHNVDYEMTPVWSRHIGLNHCWVANNPAAVPELAAFWHSPPIIIDLASFPNFLVDALFASLLVHDISYQWINVMHWYEFATELAIAALSTGHFSLLLAFVAVHLLQLRLLLDHLDS